MKILFYGAKDYDQQFFDKLKPEYPDIEFVFIESNLYKETASLAAGYDGICAFVNADLSADVIEELHQQRIRLILMRCAGYNNVDLAKAKECGIDICVNTKEKNFGEALVEAFGPDKADVIYDCAGNNITMGQAIQYARKGSVIVLVAVFADMATVDLAVANDHELDIKSTMMYRHDDYVDAIDLVNAGKVHLKPLISKTFKFADYLKAYQYIDENRETTMKVIINVQEK